MEPAGARRLGADAAVHGGYTGAWGRHGPAEAAFEHAGDDADRDTGAVPGVAVAVAELTPRQALFVQEYLVDLNATQAAIRAGYSSSSAAELGSRLVEKSQVAAAIAKAKAERSKRTGINADRVLEELARIAFSDMGEFADWSGEHVTLRDSSQIDTRCVVEVKQTAKQFGADVGIKLHDKLGALNALAKHLGLLPEKHEHEITLRREAERLAGDIGCTPEELLADVAGMKGRRN